MKFSLRKMLLLFPAYFLAVSVSTLFEDGTPVYRQYMLGSADARGILHMIVAAEYHHGSPIPEQVVNKWIAGELTPEEAAEFKLVKKLEGVRFRDQWGRLFQYAGIDDVWLVPIFDEIIDGPNDRRYGHSDEFPVGVYSLGPDGVSRSRGNDPDDINTWNWQRTFQYYRALEQTEAKRRHAWWGLCLLPFTFLGLVAAGWVWQITWRRVVGRRNPSIEEPADAAQGVGTPEIP